MNNWYNEVNAEYQRQRILEQSEEIRLQTLATSSREYQPGLLGRTMFNLANWMISTGSQLRKRYEAPPLPCAECPAGSYAP